MLSMLAKRLCLTRGYRERPGRIIAIAAARALSAGLAGTALSMVWDRQGLQQGVSHIATVAHSRHAVRVNCTTGGWNKHPDREP